MAFAFFFILSVKKNAEMFVFHIRNFNFIQDIMYVCAEHECRVLSRTLFLTQQYHLSNSLLSQLKQVYKTLAKRCIFT